MKHRYIHIYADDITLIRHNVNQTSLETDVFYSIQYSIVQHLNEMGFNTNKYKFQHKFNTNLITF